MDDDDLPGSRSRPAAPAPGSAADGTDGESGPRSGWGGCALWAAAFVFVILGGCAVGLALRDDGGKAQEPKTVEAGANWVLQVNRDDTGAPCTNLLADDGTFLAGQCAYATDVDPKDPTATPRYKATSAKVGEEVVVFGPVPSEVASVRLKLVDGSQPTARTGSSRGVNYFVKVVPVADQGPTILLDKAGKPVSPPSDD